MDKYATKTKLRVCLEVGSQEIDMIIFYYEIPIFQIGPLSF